MASLVVIAMICAGIARTTGFGATRLAEPSSGVSVDLHFEDGPAGTIRVTEATGGSAPVIIMPGESGFVRTALRSLARERQAAGIGAEVPFRLGRTDDGRLWLRDIATGRVLYLDAYGPQSAQSFARLLGLQPRSAN
jgi:putative photosynthetic complex assembly protein